MALLGHESPPPTKSTSPSTMPLVASLTTPTALLVPQDSAGTSKELQPAPPTGLIVHAGKVNGPGTFMPWKSLETINPAIL